MKMNKLLIPVAEIFSSIQGEGPNTGLKVIFCRVAGCDFRCSWCDSKFAQCVTKDTVNYTSDELYEALKNKCDLDGIRHIVFTGGNPCLYTPLGRVIFKLLEEGIKSDIETQGSILPDWLNFCDNVIISPKAPSSKMPDVYEHIEKWFKKIMNDFFTTDRTNVVIKIPVFSVEDLEFVRTYYELYQKFNKLIPLKFYINVGNDDTTQTGDISPRILANYRKLVDMIMKTDMEEVYIMCQVHTLLWGNKQGV
jgi:7-carboxy-7-deazaguanine synthase